MVGDKVEQMVWIQTMFGFCPAITGELWMMLEQVDVWFSLSIHRAGS